MGLLGLGVLTGCGKEMQYIKYKYNKYINMDNLHNK